MGKNLIQKKLNFTEINSVMGFFFIIIERNVNKSYLERRFSKSFFFDLQPFMTINKHLLDKNQTKIKKMVGSTRAKKKLFFSF
jgi:hypothetical protein